MQEELRSKSRPNFAHTFVGTLGLRLDKAEGRRARAVAWLGMVTVYYLVDLTVIHSPGTATGASGAMLREVSVWYALTVWMVYYGGIIVVLGTPAKRWLADRFGEARAYLVYETVLGVVFLNQGFSQAVLMYAFGSSFPAAIPVWLTWSAGTVLILVGTTFKLWSAHLAGLDTFYCRDMFLDRRIDRSDKSAESDESGLVASGPYRYFRNPMYGIGTVHAYGFALWCRSVEGLAVAALFQCSIYLFYAVAERPFVNRVYAPCARSAA
ncbi:PEMT/PEM2 methyltransferase family protein [Streptomyces phaeochromogenes]|uniref:PEMT/PEM2 family methyltransferase n=1 Tax=Streptomyces phaeochromogenes TaxID=1923 RepID=UPI0033E90731